MKAFRKKNGVITEIQVDVGRNGEPLLPPNTTVEPKPLLLEGHFLDIVNGEWQQFPEHVHVETLEEAKDKACKQLAVYRDWVIDRPVEHEGKLFDADETARTRLTGAVTAHGIGEALPSVWVAKDNSLFPIKTIADLQALAAKVYSEFNSRFSYVTDLRLQILAAETLTELEALEMPVVGLLPGEEPVEHPMF